MTTHYVDMLLAVRQYVVDNLASIDAAWDADVDVQWPKGFFDVDGRTAAWMRVELLSNSAEQFELNGKDRIEGFVQLTFWTNRKFQSDNALILAGYRDAAVDLFPNGTSILAGANFMRFNEAPDPFDLPEDDEQYIGEGIRAAWDYHAIN